MKPLINNPVKVFVTGFIVLLFLSLSLFWIRFTCETSLKANNFANSVRIQPSGLVPSEFEDDPKVINHSIASARIGLDEQVFLGIFDYFFARFPGGRRLNVYYLRGNDKWIYFDKKLGLLACRYSKIKRTPDKFITEIDIELYLGPEGVSTIPDKTLGRFIEPIIDGSGIYFHQEQFSERFLYDKKLRQFFKIDFDKQTIVKGPKFNEHNDPKPIQIGFLHKNTYWDSILHWQPPKVPNTEDAENSTRSHTELKPIIPFEYGLDAGPYILVLDETGRIDLLNKETLEFAGTAGRLPATESYFGTMQPGRPQNLLSYDVQPLVLYKLYVEDDRFEDGRLYEMVFNGRPSSYQAVSKVDIDYLGMFATSLSRDGTALALTVFNAEGKHIKTQYTKGEEFIDKRYNKYVSSSKAVFWETPWAPFTTIIKYSVENLHPLILSLGSYFTASTFEAASGQRALFLLPNSFIAMVGRNLSKNFAERFLTALWWILPSIILSIILARRVAKDATIVGLSKNVKTCWIIGTIAFGLTAYITYKLTKPKITLVTCQNCGKPRRPDMEKCHRCKSHWYVPELTSPAWRVIE